MAWSHGVPTVSVMDLAIQARRGDLVLGTHGRGAYVLDDITPLRGLTAETLSEPLVCSEEVITAFPPKPVTAS